jgi:hypothetical protein
MKAKLIKTGGDYLLRDMGGDVLAITNGTTEGRKLSKQNCDEIFGVVDVEKLAEDFAKNHSIYPTAQDDTEYGFKHGFKKAIELNKDKLFTLEDMMNCWNKALKFQEHKQTLGEYIQSLQQPTEIEVEIVTEEFESYNKNLDIIKKPILDSEGCLILKKI